MLVLAVAPGGMQRGAHSGKPQDSTKQRKGGQILYVPLKGSP